jgi:hypothetical protein
VKLSEAMMLGSTMGLKFKNDDWCTCLLGISMAALGQRNDMNREAERRYPWILKDYVYPMSIHPRPFKWGITWWADRIECGLATFEEAIDWVRSVEPQDETNSTQASPAATARDEKETVNV